MMLIFTSTRLVVQMMKALDMLFLQMTDEYDYSVLRYSSANFSCILNTKWGQNSPYNYGILAVKGEDYPTGCASTAISQIMAF